MTHLQKISGAAVAVLLLLNGGYAVAAKGEQTNQEWLLIATSMGYYASPSIGDGGYSTETLCKEAGQVVVARMNAKEVSKQRANTKTNDTGGTTQSYVAKSWTFECIPVRKR